MNDISMYAKAIFGEDIVELAFEDTKYSKEGSEISEECIHPEDACPVTIVFKNGKKIKLWVSEWGGIDSIS